MEKEKKLKIGFVSLGCSKNAADTEVMLAELDEAGFEITPDETEADVIVVNTCAFIESAKQEAIDTILDVAWLKENANLQKIIVTGCLAERYRDEIFRELPEVDAVLGVGSIHNIVEAVKAALAGEKYASYEDKNSVRLGGARVVTTPPYMAYIKIAEGCDNRCTYCAIPNIRGRFRSRPMEDIVEEAKLLSAAGAKEISLIAQDTTRYGTDLYGKQMLVPLIQAICRETDVPWIRLLYCYADKITDELIEEMAANDRVVHYIDMPIQHINDEILRRMNRRYTAEQYAATVEYLREKIPDVTLSSDIIVGFPGESEQDFEDTLSMLKKIRFDMLFSFIYSPRKGTPAAEMENQIPREVQQARFDRLLALQKDIGLEKNQELVGIPMRVLCDGVSKNDASLYSGRTEGNKIAFFEGSPEDTGRFVTFTADRADAFAFYGKKQGT